ncbi:hypothetical protein [Lysinibacillus sp. NPDC056232]
MHVTKIHSDTTKNFSNNVLSVRKRSDSNNCCISDSKASATPDVQ